MACAGPPRAPRTGAPVTPWYAAPPTPQSNQALGSSASLPLSLVRCRRICQIHFIYLSARVRVT